MISNVSKNKVEKLHICRKHLNSFTKVKNSFKNQLKLVNMIGNSSNIFQIKKNAISCGKFFVLCEHTYDK